MRALVKTAIRGDNPVVFFEHKYMYSRIEGSVPQEESVIPLGKGAVKCPGEDLTIIATGYMVHQALAAAENLAVDGILE
jgi:pyruvate/2-oxoglutarate/acetoin dehydrogenase E1 component